ncbi:hypothetical protein PMI16_00828 [Herbaspirillum sp. CF444]|uniref:hypothetical protein n=1 Tax=Herbaspirillum sp. CF444 TaxID=1144319 RepID=UPI0002724B8D|nr:hypothetical protein [Herbaspirillum sp. CF444]EJL92676.1 hypothetical protein PMI16_00828 [Herbaspirillum sp. CF444]
MSGKAPLQNKVNPSHQEMQKLGGVSGSAGFLDARPAAQTNSDLMRMVGDSPRARQQVAVAQMMFGGRNAPVQLMPKKKKPGGGAAALTATVTEETKVEVMNNDDVPKLEAMEAEAAVVDHGAMDGDSKRATADPENSDDGFDAATYDAEQILTVATATARPHADEKDAKSTEPTDMQVLTKWRGLNKKASSKDPFLKEMAKNIKAARLLLRLEVVDQAKFEQFDDWKTMNHQSYVDAALACHTFLATLPGSANPALGREEKMPSRAGNTLETIAEYWPRCRFNPIGIMPHGVQKKVDSRSGRAMSIFTGIVVQVKKGVWLSAHISLPPDTTGDGTIFSDSCHLKVTTGHIPFPGSYYFSISKDGTCTKTTRGDDWSKLDKNVWIALEQTAKYLAVGNLK